MRNIGLILFGSMLLWVASFAGCTRDTETRIDRGDKPNLDALAARGALFENVHAQYHKRRGSVPQYMTGRYFPVPGFIGFWRESWRKRLLEERYIGEILTANGYQSVMFTAHGFFGQGSRIHSSFDEVKPGAEDRPQGRTDDGNYSVEDQEYLRGLYDGSILRADERLGELFAMLEAEDELECIEPLKTVMREDKYGHA